jgi:hypothetical protein
MRAGDILGPGHHITSTSGRYRFVYQGDGNLVLYDSGRSTWASHTSGKPAGVCVMQADGNLVVYAPGPHALWASKTAGHRGSGLVLQDDGNTVICDADGHPLWATDTGVPTGPQATGSQMRPGETLAPGQQITSPSGRYRFVYQADGNLVLYDAAGATWASHTSGKPAGVCIMQADGNLVVYAPGPHALWASRTAGHRGSSLVLQDDGNTVIHAPDGHPLWATNTAGKPASG